MDSNPRLTWYLRQRNRILKKRDIASSEDNKKKMRDLIGDQKAIAPQLFNDDQYCGNYDAFELANEDGELEAFLKL
ncbi:putative SH3 domain-binding glutamic acid-rich-like protein 3 [Apostichopus japonicus]|uniref:Putative SH3 domain-binding glutamic acid-rich-like protein 3 n=1 Tax=Stichopus japonicus TaxID=307972 RepID=A0A2G8L5M9_STIJA|nr:putative SH3 domain-binding glutamic acid-rich-like protein 3 [Apostichopus japonicus]